MVINALGFTPIRSDANKYISSNAPKVLSKINQNLLSTTLTMDGCYLVMAQVSYHGTNTINKDITISIYNTTKNKLWCYKKIYAGKENDIMGAGEIMTFCYASDGARNDILSLQAMISDLGVIIDEYCLIVIRL